MNKRVRGFGESIGFSISPREMGDLPREIKDFQEEVLCFIQDNEDLVQNIENSNISLEEEGQDLFDLFDQYPGGEELNREETEQAIVYLQIMLENVHMYIALRDRLKDLSDSLYAQRKKGGINVDFDKFKEEHTKDLPPEHQGDKPFLKRFYLYKLMAEHPEWVQECLHDIP